MRTGSADADILLKRKAGLQLTLHIHTKRPPQYVVGLAGDAKQIIFATIVGDKSKDVTHLIYDVVQHIYFDSRCDKLNVVRDYIRSWCETYSMRECWSVSVHMSYMREAMAVPVINFQRGIVTWYYQKPSCNFGRAVVGCVTRIPELHAWPITTLQQHIAHMMNEMRNNNNGDDFLRSGVLRKR